ncbi:hypothetical protein HMPREF3291_01500 [Bacillus sp. HMSC76G11]|nr:hypothetical protein HMPREF3291_01500 [Bacillus sp. HMSC76G11]
MESNETEKKELNISMGIKKSVLVFIILQLILIIIGLIVYLVFGKFTQPTVILDQVSFTSGIISIILAVVAIVYAFLQSREASSQNKLVHEGLLHINKRIEQFTSIKEDFNSMTKVLEKQSAEVNASVEKVNNIVNDIQELSTQIQDKGELSEDIEKDLQVINAELKEIKKNNQTNSYNKYSNKFGDLLSNQNFTFDSSKPSFSYTSQNSDDILTNQKITADFIRNYNDQNNLKIDPKGILYNPPFKKSEENK